MDGGVIIVGLAITGIIFLAIKLATPIKGGDLLEDDNNEKHTIENKGYIKICIGIVIIVLSPLIGTLLFYPYSILLSTLMRTDGAIEMFWLSCILSIAILGLSIVFVGCNEKLLQHKNTVNK